MNEIVNYFLTLPLYELLAVVTSLLYVVLAAKGNIWCWPAALVSTLLYTAIFYDVYLWMDSMLQVYYMFMAIYGWYCWQSQKEDLAAGNKPFTVSKKSITFHLRAICILTVISYVLGKFMAENTPTHFPYIDAATTVFAVFTTYLVTQKILENWLYWLAIDFVSIYIYIEKGLTPTAVLFALYVIIAGYGYYQWRIHYKQQVSLS